MFPSRPYPLIRAGLTNRQKFLRIRSLVDPPRLRLENHLVALPHKK